MHKLIIITGTPSTGKSTLAKAIAKKYGWERLDLHDYYHELAISYNHKKECFNLDKKRLRSLIEHKMKGTSKPLVFDSHISHLLPAKLVRLCIVLTANLKTLQQRLRKRNYSKTKIRENLDAEIFQVCLLEAKEQGHKVVVFDTAMDSISTILRKIKTRLA